MNPDLYKDFTAKSPLKKKPRTRPLPKAGEKYLEAFERFKEILDRMEIKYEEYFHFKSTKHWRFDFHLIEYRMLIEIAGGPWSGGRKGKLATKAWSMDRYDHAEEMGYRYMRFETGDIYMGRATAWLRNLKESYGPVQTIPAVESD
jgi:very-short-patch-repair endonuclease